MTTTKFMLLLACLIQEVMSPTNHEIHLTVIKVCVGQKITMKVNFGNRTVRHSRISRDGDDMDLMVYNEDKTHKEAPRVEYYSPTSIVYNNVTVNDSGHYDMLVDFDDDTSEWPEFKVNVITGCPSVSELYNPTIMYRLSTGAQKSLPSSNVIDIVHGDTVAINVTIPSATPPVTCKISGIKLLTTCEGSDDSKTYCIGQALVYGGPILENYIVRVTLEHIHMKSSFTKSIHIKTSFVDIPVEVVPGTKRPYQRAETPKVSSSHSALDYNKWTFVIVTIILCIIILPIVKMVLEFVQKTRRRNSNGTHDRTGEMETLIQDSTAPPVTGDSGAEQASEGVS